MPKRKLTAPKNCPSEIIEIWIGDEEGCFPEGTVHLPDGPADYVEHKKSDGLTIFIPKYIKINLPEGIDPREQILHYFAKGSFNAAFRNFAVGDEEDANDAATSLFFAPMVLKLPLGEATGSALAELDEAKRAVRVFNECNESAITNATTDAESAVVGGKFLGEARVIGNGWLAPYIVGEQATSEEKCRRSIKLFNERQRIVVDSYVENNLLTDKKGRIWFIDSGCAFQLGFNDPVESADAMQEKSPKSKASFCVWSSEEIQFAKQYERHFLKMLFPTESANHFPLKQGERIRKFAVVPPEILLNMALLYIQKEYPAVRNASCLETSPALIQYFAAAYIQQIRQKHFSDSHEIVPALNINEDKQKLIGLNEPVEKLAQLIQANIDRIETIGVQSLRTPQFSVNQHEVSGFPLQETQKGGVSLRNQPPVAQQHQPEIVLRTAKFRQVKTAILRKIDECVYLDKRYAGIPSLSLDEPVGNIDILRGVIQSSRNFEDMRNRLTQLSNTKDVKSKPKLLALYSDSLESIKTRESKFKTAYTRIYGEHANKLVPLKMELERQILNDTKTATEDEKATAAQLIESINRCENEDAILQIIFKAKINAACLVSCCKIVMKPIFKEHSGDLKYCSNNKESMSILYTARKKADEAKSTYVEAKKNTSENSNETLIAQLGKIKAELEYRKTLYELRGAKNEKSWWPWSTSINTKLFATNEMLTYIENLGACIDPKSPSSKKLSTIFPTMRATREGKLGDISKEITSFQIMINAYHNSTRLSAENLSAFQPVNQADTIILLNEILRLVKEKVDSNPLHVHFAKSPIIGRLKEIPDEISAHKNFKTQQELTLFILEKLFPDESGKIPVVDIPKEQLASHKIASLQNTFRTQLKNNKLLDLVVNDIRTGASNHFVKIIDSLIGADLISVAQIKNDSTQEQVTDDDLVEDNDVEEQVAAPMGREMPKDNAVSSFKEDPNDITPKEESEITLDAWKKSGSATQIKDWMNNQTDPLLELKKEVIKTLFPNTNQQSSTSLSPIIDTSSTALQSIRQEIVKCDSVGTLLNLLTNLKSQSAAMPSQQQFDTCIKTIKELCPEPGQTSSPRQGK